jgi:hypothetical protein
VKAVVDLLTPEHEHEFEAETGLPEALPANETLLWQGKPDTWLLARQALHLDKVLVYFAVLLAWRGVGSWYDGASLGATLAGMAGMLPLIVLALGLLATIAWLSARTTVYTLTNKRVVMRVGMVLSITFNLPFAQIASAALRRRGPEGAGDITLSLNGPDRIAYMHLWPHVRPWQLKRTQPMLRALPDAAHVAQTLAHALRQAEAARQATPAAPLRAVVTAPREPVSQPSPAHAAPQARAA